MERVSRHLILSTQSGRLKPEVRLGVAVSEFAQSLDDDRKREFQKMQAAGKQLSGRDAIRVTEELNREIEGKHCTWRPYGTKCGKFLDRLQTLATIGDVMIGGSQNVIATSIWCAVRLSLQTANNFRGYFERLSNLFMKLGTSWELHNEFAQIFPQSEALQTFLCEYLIVLMRLCRKAVVFSNKSLAGQLWSSLGASFDSEFKPVQEEMDKWGLMIQHKTQQLATAYAVDAEKFRRRDYKQRVLHVLSPNQLQHNATWRRHRRKGDCKWIYQTEAYISWMAQDISSIMCVSGKLGSGKTVSMASLVAHINMQQPCGFFFCSPKEPESSKATTVLGSLAFHLLESIQSDDAAWDNVTAQEDINSLEFTSTGISHLMVDLLPESKKYVLVVDGLENCPDDEINEIIFGLRRLMARRTVLLCYSARSGSMFQYLTVQELPAKFSVSLEENMHDEEMQAYITEEIARRRQTSQPGLFTDELAELIKRQLSAGAQGMYLWVTLQLDSIFPRHSRAVVTYEQILSSLNNLPKDLPEAFEKALKQIIDDRYGNSIMKIVMAARSPLTLDELKVALTVVPGDPIWYATKAPLDALQLIALCGGNLLELDEEDGKVRFIHKSVMNHLLQTVTDPFTKMYHFSIEDAEIYVGAICLTFLSIPLFGTALTMTKNITGQQLTENVGRAISRKQSLTTDLARHFKRRNLQHSTPTDFDIGRLVFEIQAASIARFDPHCFQDYAVSNWLSHARYFEKGDPLCVKVWDFWVRLICGEIQAAKTPFQSPVEDFWPALYWALMHHHRPLFHMIFENPTMEPRNAGTLSQQILVLEDSPSGEMYDPDCLGLMLVHLLQLSIDPLLSSLTNENDQCVLDNTDTSLSTQIWPSVQLSLQKLLDLGANFTIRHARNNTTVLRLLVTTLGDISEESTEGDQLYGLLQQVLVLTITETWLTVALHSPWVPLALRRIVEKRNFKTLLILLPYHPPIRLSFQEDSFVGIAVAQGNVERVTSLLDAWPGDNYSLVRESYIHGKPAIQLALEHMDRNMVMLLARRGWLNTYLGKMKFSAPLLRIALERMSVEWVELLLQLGADPNLGYAVITQDPSPHTETCYHIQMTAARNKTRKLLALIHHGADVLRPSSHCVKSIVAHHGNQVIMARLKEIEVSGPAKEVNASGVSTQGGLPPSTALLEACKMLAEGEIDQEQMFKSFGVAPSHDVARRGELKLILHYLADTTPRHRLKVQCRDGNTALHYLTGGMNRFHLEALDVASRLLAIEPTCPSQAFTNKHFQTPLHRAIERGSWNSWSLPYLDSITFLVCRIGPHIDSDARFTGNDDSVLGFAILKGAPVDPVINLLLRAGANPNATMNGATPLEIATRAPSFYYASATTSRLLTHGADPWIQCSKGGTLLENAHTARREWLQAVLQSHDQRHVGLSQPEFTLYRPSSRSPPFEKAHVYELEDTSSLCLMSLARRKSCGRGPLSQPQIHAGYQPRTRDSSPASSATSTRSLGCVMDTRK